MAAVGRTGTNDANDAFMSSQYCAAQHKIDQGLRIPLISRPASVNNICQRFSLFANWRNLFHSVSDNFSWRCRNTIFYWCFIFHATFVCWPLPSLLFSQKQAKLRRIAWICSAVCMSAPTILPRLIISLPIAEAAYSFHSMGWMAN
jgi:hypothetical protein